MKTKSELLDFLSRVREEIQKGSTIANEADPTGAGAVSQKQFSKECREYFESIFEEESLERIEDRSFDNPLVNIYGRTLLLKLSCSPHYNERETAIVLDKISDPDYGKIRFYNREKLMKREISFQYKEDSEKMIQVVKMDVNPEAVLYLNREACRELGIEYYAKDNTYNPKDRLASDFSIHTEVLEKHKDMISLGFQDKKFQKAYGSIKDDLALLRKVYNSPFRESQNPITYKDIAKLKRKSFLLEGPNLEKAMEIKNQIGVAKKEILDKNELKARISELEKTPFLLTKEENRLVIEDVRLTERLEFVQKTYKKGAYADYGHFQLSEFKEYSLKVGDYVLLSKKINHIDRDGVKLDKYPPLLVHGNHYTGFQGEIQGRVRDFTRQDKENLRVLVEFDSPIMTDASTDSFQKFAFFSIPLDARKGYFLGKNVEESQKISNYEGGRNPFEMDDREQLRIIDIQHDPIQFEPSMHVETDRPIPLYQFELTDTEYEQYFVLEDELYSVNFNEENVEQLFQVSGVAGEKNGLFNAVKNNFGLSSKMLEMACYQEIVKENNIQIRVSKTTDIEMLDLFEQVGRSKSPFKSFLEEKIDVLVKKEMDRGMDDGGEIFLQKADM